MLTSASVDELFFDQKLQKPEFCFIRMGSSAPAESFALVSKISDLGIPCFNDPLVLIHNKDKALSQSKLIKGGLPVPKTLLINSDYKIDQILEPLGGPPWVIKTRYGTKGQGVLLTESKRSLVSTLDLMFNNYSQLLVQEFIADQSGTDTRVLVIKDKAVAAMQRKNSSKDEFRSNMYLGSKAVRVDLTPEISELAVSAASALNLKIAGVDLLGSQGNYTVVEVNSSPGLSGISESNNINLAEVILTELEQLAN